MTDTELLDWAERNPERFYAAARSWWTNAGPGFREQEFHWRAVIRTAMAAASPKMAHHLCPVEGAMQIERGKECNWCGKVEP